MISEQALDLAVRRAALTPEQAEGLRRVEAECAGNPGAGDRSDDEALRLITGFADIFVTLGIGLFTGALGYLVGTRGPPVAAFTALAVTAWLLAEFFARRRRMALPSIALLILFVSATFGALAWSLAGLMASRGIGPAPIVPLPPEASGPATLLAGAGTVALTVLHYRRFRVPITIAAGMALLLVTLLGLVFSAVPTAPPAVYYGVAFAWGLLTFALAMRFDLSDPARGTRRSDIAFWLHLLAAPLIVHTLIRGLIPDFSVQPTDGVAVSVLAAFLLLGLVALVIDRRAILVSGLVYAGVAFGTLVKTFGFGDVGTVVPVVALVLGGFILVLSAGWRSLRGALLRLLPAGAASRLPHPMAVHPS